MASIHTCTTVILRFLVPAENQIILPTPVTKVRSIWPVLSNDKVKVKIRPLNKIVAHRGSETFEITTPPATSPTTTKSTTTTKQPQIDKSKIFKNKYEKTKNKLENFNEIKGKKKLCGLSQSLKITQKSLILQYLNFRAKNGPIIADAYIYFWRENSNTTCASGP